MEAIKDTVKNVIRDMLAKKEGGQPNPEELLKNFLTKKELAHIKVKYLRKGILGLAVDSSSRLYKMNLQKQELLDCLNKEGKIVRDVRIFLGEIK
jgi:hypothetical protein